MLPGRGVLNDMLRFPLALIPKALETRSLGAAPDGRAGALAVIQAHAGPLGGLMEATPRLRRLDEGVALTAQRRRPSGAFQRAVPRRRRMTRGRWGVATPFIVC